MPRGKRSRKEADERPLRELENAPSSAQSVPVLVATEISTEQVDDRETLVHKARESITNSMPEIEAQDVGEHAKAVVNPRGLSLFERLDHLEDNQRSTQTELAATRTELVETKVEFAETKAELATVKAELRPVKGLVHDAREREFITHLRDYCDEYGTPRFSKARKTTLQKDVASRIEALNSGRVHAGNALADADMFMAREPFNAVVQFRRIYGLKPEQIKNLSTFNSLIRILDAVGTSRYQARTMKEEEEGLLQDIVRLVDEGGVEAAEEIAKAAIDRGLFLRPFVPWRCDDDDMEETG